MRPSIARAKYLSRLFQLRRERNNLSTLLLRYPPHFRFKTRGDVKPNHLYHNILRSSEPPSGALVPLTLREEASRVPRWICSRGDKRHFGLRQYLAGL